MARRNTVASRVDAILADLTRQLFRPKTTSPLEHAYAMACNARDHARNRFEAMDFCTLALDYLDKVTDYSAGYLVRSGPIAQAKARWEI